MSKSHKRNIMKQTLPNEDRNNISYDYYSDKEDVQNCLLKNKKNDTESNKNVQSYRNYLSSILTTVATVFLSVSRQSTIHSLSHVAQARNTKQQLMWLIIGLAALLGFMVNLRSLIVKYFDRPVLTNIYHDHTSFVYPDVTICNVNPLYFGHNGDKKNSSLSKLLKEFDEKDKIVHENSSEYVNNVMNIHENPDISDLLFVQHDVEYGHPPWSFIIKCIYMQTRCDWSDFEIRHLWPFGNCFTFNVSKLAGRRTRNVQKSMIKNGWRPDFKIVMYKGLNYLQSFGRDPFSNINTPSGVLVIVHEADTYPYKDEGIYVDSYTQIDLKITTKFHINVNNKCDFYPKIYSYYDFRSNSCVKFLGRQSDCITELVQENIGKQCGCVLHTIPIPCFLQKYPFCISVQHNMDSDLQNNTNLLLCLEKSMNKLTYHNKHSNCHRDLCNHTSFTTVVSHSSYPAVKERQNHRLWLEVLRDLERKEMKFLNNSKIYQHALKKDFIDKYKISSIKQSLLNDTIDASSILDENFVNRNFMQVRIVPSSLFMDHIEESIEYPLSRLLGDVGGCIGLWVGASLITIFELIDFILRCFDIFCSYRNKNGNNIKNEKDTNTIYNTFSPLEDSSCLFYFPTYPMLQKKFVEGQNEDIQ